MRTRQGLISTVSILAIAIMLTACGQSEYESAAGTVAESASVEIETGTSETEATGSSERESIGDGPGTRTVHEGAAADTNAQTGGTGSKDCGEVGIPESYAHQGPPRYVLVVAQGNLECSDAITVSEIYFRSALTPTDMMGWGCTDFSAIPGGYTPGAGAPVVECISSAGDSSIHMYVAATRYQSDGVVPDRSEPLKDPAEGVQSQIDRIDGSMNCGPFQADTQLTLTVEGPGNDCATAQNVATLFLAAEVKHADVGIWDCGILGAALADELGYVVSCKNSRDGTAIRLWR